MSDREKVIEWLNNNGFVKPTSKILPMDSGHFCPVVSVILQCMDYVKSCETNINSDTNV